MSASPEMSKYFRTFPCQASAIASELSSVLDRGNFRDAYLLDSLLSKYVGVGSLSPDELAQKAYQGVRLSESRNARSNTRIRNLWNKHRFGSLPSEQVFQLAQRLIKDCIGEYSHEIFERAKFTSGAAVGYSRARGDLWYKFNGRVTCTLAAAKYVLALIQCHPLWVKHLTAKFGPDPVKWIKIVAGNKGFTVRKNCEEDRFACKEPTGNMLLQTSIGSHFRRCLRKVGIDLNDQEPNRVAAFWGSITDEDSTLDLRKASDSCVRALVALLFDEEWFRAMRIARSPFGEIDGVVSPWEMMSSMGNGFTFELESLIFWALSEAVRRLSRCPGRVLVYGDDIVVPKPIAHKVIAVLGFCGFRTNQEKSFISGPFRESCGGHYRLGVDVTPFYIRKPITDTSRVIWFLNALRKWCDVGGVCDPRLEPLYKRYRRKFVDCALWGGTRYSSISSLAGPERPRKRLKFLTNARRIDGVAAVLRTFQYQRVSSEVSYQANWRDTSRWIRKEGRYEVTPTQDPQIQYEMMGVVPLTSDMTRICVVSSSVSDEDNCEVDGDSIGLWPFELGRIAPR